MKTPNVVRSECDRPNQFSSGAAAPVRYLSAAIIAQNEEDCIAKAIRSCQLFADEVVVVDGGSDDRTVEIARQLGATLYQNPWPGYAAQRNFAAERAEHDWIFFLDADEIAGQQLCTALLNWKQQPVVKASAFSIIRIGDFLGTWLDGKPDSETMVRLYDKRVVRIKDTIVHEVPDIDEREVARLSGVIWHQGFRTIEELTARFNKYTSLDAQKSYLSGRKFSWFRLIFKPPAKFFQKYIWHGMYKCGLAGFAVSSLWSFYAFLWEIKLFEIYWQKQGGTAPMPKE